MKNIEIIVDATGSCNLEEIESQLKKIKDELNDDSIKATVSFYSLGERLNKDLKLLELPLSDDDIRYFFMGGDDFTEVVKGKVKNNPDTIIFIGDFCESPLQPNAFRNCNNIQLIMIQTTYEKKMDRRHVLNFIDHVKDIVEVDIKITDVEKYNSLEDILNSKVQVQNKIKQLRFLSNKNDSDPKLKP